MPGPGSTDGAQIATRGEGGREQLGRYELIKRLATGGMAEIYLAKVKGLEGFEKIVVVKRILPQLASNSEFVQMFLDEARIAATLHHSNVVQVYDIGSVGGSFFFSMEFLHGEDVRMITKKAKTAEKGLPIEIAIAINMGVCAGIHYAHEKVGFDGKPLNIVHRDITPQNVFVTYDGGVKVVDFGIAKASNRYSETRYGTLKGKIPYMSPEQCRSDTLDRRSDIFSIAIMLYEMTTGARLYQGNSEFEILKTIVETDPPPPSFHAPDYPPALEKIVMKGLARKREERYQTAQDLELDLEEFARENRMNVSPIRLARYMESLFGHKIEAWREAQKEGKQLADHLIEDAPLLEDPDLLEEEERDENDATVASPHRDRSQSRSTPRPRPVVAEPVEDAGAGEEQTPAPRGHRKLVVAIVACLVLGGAAAVVVPGLRHGAKAPAPTPIAHAVAPTTGGLEIVSQPAGARVIVDGKAEKTPAPLEIGGLPLGAPIHVSANLPGYVPWQGDVLLTADRPSQPLSIELQPETRSMGMLQVRIAPPTAAASLFLDAVPVKGPLVPEVVQGVAHTLLVQAPGFEDALVQITIPKGKAVEPVTVTLHAVPGARPAGRPSGHGAAAGAPAGAVAVHGTGRIVVDSDPWANVTLDGRPLGPTPLLHVEVSAGRHVIRLSNPQFGIDTSEEITVPAGGEFKKRFSFPGH